MRLPTPSASAALAVALVAALGPLAACSSLKPLSDEDMNACEARANEQAPGERNPNRLRIVDDCMSGRAWRASKGCVESNSQGSRFCDYQR